MDNNLAGLPAKKFHLESRWNSYFHVDSMWNHLESMGEGKVLESDDERIHSSKKQHIDNLVPYESDDADIEMA